jgi:hypothetical protein
VLLELRVKTCFSHAENSNTVSQHNTNETKEDPHADSDEPCEMKEDSLEQPTEGTDEEDPLGESTGGANEGDTKVGKILKFDCVQQLLHWNYKQIAELCLLPASCWFLAWHIL